MMVRRAISFHVPSSGDKKRQSSLLLHNMRQLQVRAIYSLLTSNHSGNHISVHFTHIKYVFNIIFTISQLLKLRPYTWTLDKEAPVKGVENLVVVDKEEKFTKAKQIQIRLHHLQSVLYLLLLEDWGMQRSFFQIVQKTSPPTLFRTFR